MSAAPCLTRAFTTTIDARIAECHCGAAAIHTEGGAIGAAWRATGFTPVPNSSCGFAWICPKCLPNIKAALSMLIAHFGPDASHMHFASLIIGVEKGEL